MKSIKEMIAEGIAAIRTLFAAGHPIVIAFSGGKDSSVVANLVLLAVKEAVRAGQTPIPAGRRVVFKRKEAL